MYDAAGATFSLFPLRGVSQYLGPHDGPPLVGVEDKHQLFSQSP